jgi:CheY-like chemotaxis protein
MNHSILILDDEQQQAEGLLRFIKNEKPTFTVNAAYQEADMLAKIENLYFSIALVDLQMNDYTFDGIDLIEKIIEYNPFAKIIVVTGYFSIFESRLNNFFKTGKIVAVIEKTSNDIFKPEILSKINQIVVEAENNHLLHQKTLEMLYADAKNETNAYLKGSKFEYFITMLFAQMGFIHISKRLKDRSLNEVDLVVRNEINDLFFQKFKAYILIECKNTETKVDKNNFKLFYEKIKETNGLSNLGFLITSNSFTWNTYFDAIRTSKENCKVVFITQKEIYRLIYSINILETLKSIIDEQVKDN